MAKKGVKKMIAAPESQKARAIRLELPPAAYERVDRHARKRGLNKASFARMAILRVLDELDEEDKRKAGGR
jgi:hypothetical protein